MTKTQVLEINLISAQGLKAPSANLRRFQTYALTWINSSTKLRTRIDRVGGENPTWNDKFLFRVSQEFLSSDTSGVSVEIYAVGYLSDHLIGSVRLLISNFFAGTAAGAVIRTPSFTALQIRRPSGKFMGVMNIGLMVIDGSDFSALTGVSAIGYRDLMGERTRHIRRRNMKSDGGEVSGDSCENSCAESGEFSDGADSSTSSSSTASTTLKDWNGIRDLAGNKGLKGTASNGLGFLCGLLCQRRIEITTHTRTLRSESHESKAPR